MISMNKNDLLWCVRRLPKIVMEEMKEASGKLIIAGGYIRSCVSGEHINDVDMFGCDKQYSELVARRLSDKYKKNLITTDNAYTIAANPFTIQLIHRWIFDNPHKIVDSFDFTIAKSCFWYDNGWQSLCHDEFYADLAAKRLVYTSPVRNEDAGGSLLRVLKFYQRGYRIPLDSMGAVLARLFGGIDKDKLNCGEIHISKILTGLLREVDPLVDPDHISHLPPSVSNENEETI